MTPSTAPGDEGPDPAAASGQYFTRHPGSDSATMRVEVLLPETSFVLTTDRGVFSHGRLDTGTGILLRQRIAVPASGDLLDLGCGAGPIALALARRAPAATVWAVDVNERALELCRRNARDNGIANVHVARPDELPPDVRFATIWSNPPIRIGKGALHALLVRWLERLAPGGDMVLVVQKHLGADSLQRWLDSEGWQCERIASKAAFRVLRIPARR